MARSEKTQDGCGGCHHYQERERHGVPHARRQGPGRPPSDLHRECLWYHTAVGRAAPSTERIAVMVAEVNGGVSCPSRRKIGAPC